MPLFSNLYKSAKTKLSNRRKSNSSSSSNDSQGGKSVRFSTLSQADIYDTYSSDEYDRRSLVSLDQTYNANSILSSSSSNGAEDEYEEPPTPFDQEVLRNTKVNKKRGHYSVAVLVSYRANF